MRLWNLQCNLIKHEQHTHKHTHKNESHRTRRKKNTLITKKKTKTRFSFVLLRASFGPIKIRKHFFFLTQRYTLEIQQEIDEKQIN